MLSHKWVINEKNFANKLTVTTCRRNVAEKLIVSRLVLAFLHSVWKFKFGMRVQKSWELDLMNKLNPSPLHRTALPLDTL